MALNRSRIAAAVVVAACAVSLSACGSDPAPEPVAKTGERATKVQLPTKAAAIASPRAARGKTHTIAFKGGQRAARVVLHKSGGHGG